jgi:hypothetical protein
MMGNAGWALQSVCGKTGRRLMMSRRCRANEDRLEAGRERRYIGTGELRSWYSGSDEIDFVVGSRGKGRRASSCTSSFSKRWASGRSSGAPSGDWGIVRATQFHSKRQIRAKIVPAGSGEAPFVEGKNEQRLFAFCFAAAANQWGHFSTMMRYHLSTWPVLRNNSG